MDPQFLDQPIEWESFLNQDLILDDSEVTSTSPQIELPNFDPAIELDGTHERLLEHDAPRIHESQDSTPNTGEDSSADLFPRAGTPNVKVGKSLDVEGFSSKSHARFSKEAKFILKTWFKQHEAHSYPTAAEKAELERKTGLKRNQISLWFSNARRKHRSRPPLPEIAIPDLTLPESQTFQYAQNPFVTDYADLGFMLDYEPPRDFKEENNFERLTPMDRWKVTPIDYEPAPLPTIAHNAASSSPGLTAMAAPTAPSIYDPSIAFDFYYHPTASVAESDAIWSHSLASYETGLTSTLPTSSSAFSAITTPSLIYARSIPPSHSSSMNGSHYRRRCRPTKPPSSIGNKKQALSSSSGPGKPAATQKRPFKCTFCKDKSFATKYDWQRHETSQHLSLQSWTCSSFGPTLLSSSGALICAFCPPSSAVENPSTEHLEKHHNYSECSDKSIEHRTFYRKDHLVQHLKLTHGAGYCKEMEVWRCEVESVRSRCGFCGEVFASWKERSEHLAKEFRKGRMMGEWQRGWGFETWVEALVEGAEVDRGGSACS